MKSGWTPQCWALGVLLLGCSAAPVSTDAVVITDGKADDFLSLSAQEFVVEGRSSVTLESDYDDATDEERQRRVEELIGYKQILISWFLNEYLMHKDDDADNAEYGGFDAMAKADSYDALDIRDEGDRTYSFTVQQVLAGDARRIQRIPTRIEDGRRVFDLVIGTPSNVEMARLETNHEWYRESPWSSFNPAELSEDQKATLTLALYPEEESQDAWFDYSELFADGRLTIDVHMGWDYHDAFHVKHAESLFNWLTRRGFTAPVASFDALTRTSGALTNTLMVQGQEVVVEVRIYYGLDGSETDPNTDAGGTILEDDLRESLRTRDVIMYSGHSGPFYGFAMGNWRVTSEGDLDDSEMRSVEMPEERYQLVVAEGCDTYQIGEAFRNNPAKPDGRYIDIITTTAPSNAASGGIVQHIISRLTETNAAGEHAPETMKALLRDLDGDSPWFSTMYGIHGIDDNPQRHPYGDEAMLCETCREDSDCGGPGNRCVQLGEENVCAITCTTDAGCPDGYACRAIGSQSTYYRQAPACVPTTLRCE